VDTLKALSQQLAGGEVTSARSLRWPCRKSAIAAAKRTRFLNVTPEAARPTPIASIAVRAAGPGVAFRGIPLAIKDLFDVAGRSRAPVPSPEIARGHRRRDRERAVASGRFHLYRPTT